jgi:hypothetical protein
MNGWTKVDFIAGLPMRPAAFSSVVFFPGVVTKTSQRGLQGVREQTVVLDAAAGSNLPVAPCSFSSSETQKEGVKGGCKQMKAILSSIVQRMFSSVPLIAVAAIFVPGTQAQVAPPPASVGAQVPLTYFGPAPADVQKELIGPFKLLKAGDVDLKAETVTLPLYQGKMRDGRNVWYILTDTTDAGNAAALGLNFSAKLNYAAVGRAARHAILEKDTTLTFESGTVDFAPKRRVVPGDAPNYFPPKVAEPGSIGDEDYSPLGKIDNAGGAITTPRSLRLTLKPVKSTYVTATPTTRSCTTKW